MNKMIILMRHGEAGVALRDVDRPLTEEGKKKCQAQGQLLERHHVVCNALISSPAARAWSSAVAVADVLSYPEDNIISEAKLYNAPADVLVQVVAGFDDSWNTVLLMAHNPGISSFARELCPSVDNDLDVSEFYAIAFPPLYWSDITACKGQLITYA